MERDGSTIVPEEVQRYVNDSLVHFIENECRWIVIEGIHRVIVSYFSHIPNMPVKVALMKIG